MNGLVFLIGYRGTGKTATAERLAQRLGWDWRDADTVLEAAAGRTIRQIFAEEGERAFRDLESRVLGELSQLNRHVVATGGGVVLRPENRANLRRGRVVWLTAEPAILWQRMQADHATAERRPNLAQGGLAEIEEMLRVRTPWYAECADFRIDTETRPPDEVAGAIAEWLEAPA